MNFLNDSTLDTRTKASEGIFLQLTHPITNVPLEENGLKVGLTILGKDSDQFSACVHRRNNKRLASKAPVAITSEQSEAENLELLADMTTGWQNIDGFGEFSRAAVIALFRKFPWIKEQVDAAVVDRSNFI